jgi:hypothetical protein
MYYIVEGYSEKAPIYIIWCRWKEKIKWEILI